MKLTKKNIADLMTEYERFNKARYSCQHNYNGALYDVHSIIENCIIHPEHVIKNKNNYCYLLARTMHAFSMLLENINELYNKEEN